jgi:tetratricopeptide (TPR) repeat protein
MKLLLTLLLALLLTVDARACLNGYRTTLGGGAIDIEFGTWRGRPQGRDLAAEAPANRQWLRAQDSLWRAHHRLEDYSDYGVALVYLGRYREAQAVFEAIEAQRPGLYATAANLGTTYELLGQNERALHWITRAVQLNPKSHEGSEWIHVNILKAKLRGPAGITSQQLLGTDFGRGLAPTTTLAEPELLQLRAALYYQLTERLSFVPAPDPVVARLLFDLGNIYALTVSLEEADPVFEQARAYGGVGPLLWLRSAYFTLVELYVDSGPFLLLPVLLIGGGWWYWRRRKKRKAVARRLVAAGWKEL